MVNIILLNGTSSAGKSTLSKALRNEYPTYCYFASDQLADTGFRPLIRSNEERSRFFDGFHRSIACFADAGCDLIVEHIIEESSWLSDLTRLLASHHKVLWVGVHCPLEVLQERETNRGNRTAGEALYHLKTHDYMYCGKCCCSLYDTEVNTHTQSTDEIIAQILLAAKSKFTKKPQQHQDQQLLYPISSDGGVGSDGGGCYPNELNADALRRQCHDTCACRSFHLDPLVNPTTAAATAAEAAAGVHVTDMSKGCDQLVYLIDSPLTAIKNSKIVVKIPIEEKDKVDKQFIVSKMAVSVNGLNASSIVYHTEDFLIETYIPGESLSLEKHRDIKSVWVNLGQQMKLLHSIPGATGYSNRVVGEKCTKFPIFDSYRGKILNEGNELVWEDNGHQIEGIDRYFRHMLEAMGDGNDTSTSTSTSTSVGVSVSASTNTNSNISRHTQVNPVFLHYDIAFDNIIVGDTVSTASSSSDTDTDRDRGIEEYTITLIDFADAGMGDPLEDFAYLCCYLYDTPQLECVLEGYGGISPEDRLWMEFYCMVWLTWALSGEDKPVQRAHQLSVAESIVMKSLTQMEATRTRTTTTTTTAAITATAATI